MYSKLKIEAAREKRVAADAAERGSNFNSRYLLIRACVVALLCAKYVGDYEIDYISTKSKYSARKLSDLKNKVWG